MATSPTESILTSCMASRGVLATIQSERLLEYELGKNVTDWLIKCMGVWCGWVCVVYGCVCDCDMCVCVMCV